ncbi:hypothetical protein GS455_12555 [Rhodococcus hoagii]|nr:hypothetical protein [Prescottella equi]
MQEPGSLGLGCPRGGDQVHHRRGEAALGAARHDRGAQLVDVDVALLVDRQACEFLGDPGLPGGELFGTEDQVRLVDLRQPERFDDAAGEVAVAAGTGLEGDASVGLGLRLAQAREHGVEVAPCDQLVGGCEVGVVGVEGVERVSDQSVDGLTERVPDRRLGDEAGVQGPQRWLPLGELGAARGAVGDLGWRCRAVPAPATAAARGWCERRSCHPREVRWA